MAELIFTDRNRNILWSTTISSNSALITIADVITSLKNGLGTTELSIRSIEDICNIYLNSLRERTALENTVLLSAGLLSEARQAIFSEYFPTQRVTVSFFSDGVDSLSTVVFFGSYPDSNSVIYDSLVKIVTINTSASIRWLINSAEMQWQYGGSHEYFAISGLTRVRGLPSIMALIRAHISEDIDVHWDDPTDLEFSTIIPANPRTFGLEIEFLDNGYSQQHYADALNIALQNFDHNWPVVVRGYGHSDGTFWDLKTDSSCGYELASPALTWEDWPQVEAVLRAIYASGGRINDRCGFHVHHMAQDLKATGLRRLLLLWAAYEKAIMCSVKENRRDNRYCIGLQNGMNWDQFKETLSPLYKMNNAVISMGRYRSLNVTGWWQNGRIEVRLYQGTLQPNSCKYWVYLTQQLVEIAKTTRSYEQLDRAVQLTLAENLTDFGLTLKHKPTESIVKLVETFHDVVKQRTNSAILQPA